MQTRWKLYSPCVASPPVLQSETPVEMMMSKQLIIFHEVIARIYRMSNVLRGQTELPGEGSHSNSGFIYRPVFIYTTQATVLEWDEVRGWGRGGWNGKQTSVLDAKVAIAAWYTGGLSSLKERGRDSCLREVLCYKRLFTKACMWYKRFFLKEGKNVMFFTKVDKGVHLNWCIIYKGASATTTATATKTSLEKCIRAPSNFIALSPPRSIFIKCWQFSLELNCKKLYQSAGKEK